MAREGVPDTFYVFVDQTSVMTWHNYNLTGTLGSMSVTPGWDDGSSAVFPYVRNPEFGLGFMSPFAVNTLSLWGVELDAERVRRLAASRSPSRLSCIYAFGAVEDCEKASRLYGWNMGEVRPFALASDPEPRIARVNMNIMSLARTAYARSALDPSSIEALWRAYWGGSEGIALELPVPPPQLRATYDSGCLWEYLIHGQLKSI